MLFQRVFASRAVLALVLASVTFSAAQAANAPSTMPVTPEFKELDITWDGGEGKGYVYRMRIFDFDGVLAACGAGVYVKASNRSQTREIVQRAVLKMNDKSILKDFSYFTQVKRAEALGRAHAHCRSTGVATPRGDVKFDIDYGVRGVRF